MIHLPKPTVVGAAGARRLICAVRGCGEPVIGSYRSYHAWIGGVHRHYLDRWGPDVNWHSDP